MTGFYKLDTESNELLHGANFVHAPGFSLLASDIDEYINLEVLPMDGWYWFNSKDEAYSFFGLEVPAEDQLDHPRNNAQRRGSRPRNDFV